MTTPLSFFDLHCDTPLRLWQTGSELEKNALHVDLDRAAGLSRYLQCAAIWSDRRYSDEEALAVFFESERYFRAEAKKNACPILTGDGFRSFAGRRGFLLTLEDARLLCGDLANVDLLFSCGVRVVTPLWAGVSSIGGAHDTDEGLSAFGRAAVRRFGELGAILDLSHASDASAEEILFLAEKHGFPVIATHSDSRAVNAHSRNLPDPLLSKLVKAGGIVGLSLCREHLRSAERCTREDILAHLAHFLSAAPESAVAFGCDFDGTDLPDGVDGIGSIPSLFSYLEENGIPHKTLEKVFFQNAYSYFTKHLS
ncbi:MAG: membrane dipeptidase [Clostridia bacterium]|nr:membrane dipeptidase [Clostridia bacterium]